MTDDSDRWEDVGRRLLHTRLELVGHHTQQVFDRAAARVDAGEELTEEDVNDLREALEDARRVADVAAEASPEATREPDPWEFLSAEGRRELLDDHEQRRAE